jgi:uncharacterized protein (UPF0276 family)
MAGAPAWPAPLGVGLPWNPDLPAELYAADLLDFVEITPEQLCRQGPAGFVLEPALLDRARAVAGHLPMAVHGVELSIGSASGMNPAYLPMLDALHAAWPFRWHSEHLHFQMVDGAEIGVPLPLPPTAEAAALVAGRARAIQARYGLPFLLENGAHYLRDLPADPAIADEFGLMNAISAHAGCGQLLDLHNLHCNAVNHGFDAMAALDRVALDRVGEIHVAGGSWAGGFYTDAHDGAVPEPVWDLLAAVLPRVPRAVGVVFEVLDRHAARLGPELIARQVARARAIWRGAR